jgi:hypothetical protein
VPQCRDVPPEIHVRADASQHACSSGDMTVAHASLVTDSLHDKLSSPDRCGSKDCQQAQLTVSTSRLVFGSDGLASPATRTQSIQEYNGLADST